LERLALYLERPQATLFPTEADRQFAQQFLAADSRPLIAIHPGSGSSKKNWPVQCWLELSRWLLDRRPQPLLLLIGGEADGETLPALMAGLPPASVRVAQDLKLPQLAAVLEASTLFLGHDSGVSHIAAAVNTRCILLFGPTNPAVWAPAGEHVTPIRAREQEMEKIPQEQLQQEILAFLG